MENLGLCNRYKGEVCTKKRKDVSVVEGRKRRSARVHTRVTEERIYPALKVTSNSASVFHREEEW